MSLFIIKLDCDWLTVLCSLHVQFVKKVSDAESLIPNLDECRLDRSRTYNILDNSYNQAPPRPSLAPWATHFKFPLATTRSLLAEKFHSLRKMSSPRDSPELPPYDVNNNQPSKDLSDKCCTDSIQRKIFL